MTDHKDKKKPSRIKTDGQGRTVSADTIQMAQLELISTGQLEALLGSGDDASRRAIETAAKSAGHGVLARDTSTGLFQIIDDSELQAMIDRDIQQGRKDDIATDVVPEPVSVSDSTTAETPSSTDEDLSLVSTQMLRRVLDDEPDDTGGGFDPYNKS